MLPTKQSKKLTGRHVLIMLVLFFGVTIAVNGYFIFAAVDSFRGEDVKGSYRQGIDYNQRIDARSDEQSLGWSVRSNVIQNDNVEIVFSIEDQSQQRILGLNVYGTLRHPADRKLDVLVTFEQMPSGAYHAFVTANPANWRFIGFAERDAVTFRFESGVDIE